MPFGLRTHRGRRRPSGRADDPWQRVYLGLTALLGVTIVGTIGYLLLGLSLLDSVYMTVFTVSTVGYRELGDPGTAYKVFTIVLIMFGVGTALYTLSVLLETLIEGRLTDRLGRRRMDRRISQLHDHVVVCGYGRLGRTIADHVVGSGRAVVVIDRDPQRFADTEHLHVEGNATSDDVLLAAGVDRASTLIAATDDDSDNLYITLTVRTTWPQVFIVARARLESAEPKLFQAGADRVVNPQLIGGARIAALTLQPHVAEFLDVVMHDGSLEFRLGEVPLRERGALVGETLRDSHLRDRTGAMVLAIRDAEGRFLTNPPPESVMTAGSTLIAIGTESQLSALQEAAGG